MPVAWLNRLWRVRLMVSGFNWDRDGPPRPGSGSMDHPRGVKKPYVHKTEADTKRRREERNAEPKARGKEIKAAEMAHKLRTVPKPF